MNPKSAALSLLVLCGLAAAGPADSSLSIKSRGWLSVPVSDISAPYWLGCLTDARDLCCGFTRWHTGEWVTAAASVAGVAGLFSADNWIRVRIQRNRTPATDAVSSLAKPLGDGFYALPALAGSYLYGWAFEDGRARDAARFGVESFVLSGVVTSILKYGFNRHRPWDNQGPYRWAGPGISGDDQSFPSGHATTAFSVAGSIAEVYQGNYAVQIIAYALATMVGLSRLNDDAHWASDVLTGAIIGTVAAHTVVSGERSEQGRRIRITAASAEGNPGIGVTVAF
jgi:membrane-associated phospholipid phosphatase